MHPVFDRAFGAFLFDMDGTLINSLAATERIWGAWAERQGLDVEAFLPTMHGKRGYDTIAALGLDHLDIDAEVDFITKAELEDVEGIVAIDGIHGFLAALPKDRWAIVTSAPLALALRRLEAAGITPPAIMVTAEDVAIGKPNPDCFLLAAERLGIDPAHCLVFEDAPAGIAAGKAATGQVVIITATHDHSTGTPHLGLPHYCDVGVKIHAEGFLQLQA